MTASEQSLPQSEQPQEESPVNPASSPEEPTLQEKIFVHEHYLSNLIQQHQISSSAVNRLEVICFSLVKYILDSTDLDYGKLSTLMEELSSTENLFDFWQVPVELRPEVPGQEEAQEVNEKAGEDLPTEEG